MSYIVCFVVISSSALHTLYELIDWNFRKFFDTLKLLTEQFGKEKDSADILRLCLLQMDIKHLSDLEVVMNEDSYAKGRLDQIFGVMKGKVQEYQSNIRGGESKTYSYDTKVTTNDNDDEEDDSDEDGEEEDEVENEAEEETVDDEDAVDEEDVEDEAENDDEEEDEREEEEDDDDNRSDEDSDTNDTEDD